MRGFGDDGNSGFPYQISHLRHERIDIFFRRVPTAHEAGIAGADVGVEFPATVEHALDDRGGHLGEDAVGVAGKGNLDLRQDA